MPFIQIPNGKTARVTAYFMDDGGKLAVPPAGEEVSWVVQGPPGLISISPVAGTFDVDVTALANGMCLLKATVPDLSAVGANYVQVVADDAGPATAIGLNAGVPH